MKIKENGWGDLVWVFLGVPLIILEAIWTVDHIQDGEPFLAAMTSAVALLWIFIVNKHWNRYKKL